MVSDRVPDRERRGFALLIVLFGLAIVSVLAAASLGRSTAHVLTVKQVSVGLRSAALHDGALEVAAVQSGASVETRGPRDLAVMVAGEEISVRIQDVAGLVDVNTGETGMVAETIAGLSGRSLEEVQTRLNDLRASKRRLHSTRELVRLSLLRHQEFIDSSPALTVFSGMISINSAHATTRFQVLTDDRMYGTKLIQMLE